MPRFDYDASPHIWTDEDMDTAFVDVKVQTATWGEGLAWLLEHADEYDLFSHLTYNLPDAEVDPESIHFRGLSIEIPADQIDDRGRLPRAVDARHLLREGETTATWVFDISVAARLGEAVQDAA